VYRKFNLVRHGRGYIHYQVMTMKQRELDRIFRSWGYTPKEIKELRELAKARRAERDQRRQAADTPIK
jgi:hypothetical protein